MTGATLTALLDRAAECPDAGLRFLDRRERERWYGWSEVRRDALRVASGQTGVPHEAVLDAGGGHYLCFAQLGAGNAYRARKPDTRRSKLYKQA